MSTAERHARLTQLFGEAIELDATARAALIARVRAEDAELARDLVELLEVDSQPNLVKTALLPAAELAQLRAPPALPVIPGYTLGDQLGEGGMGTVYSAEQAQPRRRVAIKLLHARSEHAVLRFKLEAAAMAKLDHPGIARVLEAGDAGNRPYIVMEYVDGAALDDHAAKLPLRARLELFVAICDAVHHAHVKGVFHRDLKPANVRVRPDGTPVVLDFGVARFADANADVDPAGHASLDPGTHAGELIGTPLYMSPEQARLEPQAVDARGDVYTLGVMLYELAANALPYGDRGMPLPALTRAITDTPPIPLGKRDRTLRGDLEAITGTALEKEPARRYASVAAFAADIRHYLAGEPVSVRAPGVIERARRFVRRRPVVSAAIGAALLATATFATVVTALWLNAREARRAAETASERSEAARAALAAETTRLELRQGRDALVRDPTEALAWLAAAGSGADPDVAYAIADEAVARGVAADVIHASSEEVHWIEPMANGFLTSAYDGHVLAWQATSAGFTSRDVFTEQRGRVHLATASANGIVAVGGDHGALDLVRLDGTLVQSVPGHAGDVQHLAWHDDPGGDWLASGDDRGTALLFHGNAPPITLIASKATIGDVAFGGGFALAGDYGGSIAAVELATGKRRTTAISAGVIALWCDGHVLAAIDDKGTLHRWKLDADALVATDTIAVGAPLKRGVFAANGLAAVGTVDGDVMRVTTKVERLAHFRAQVRSLAVLPDGTLAAGSDRGELVYISAARDIVQPLLGGGRVRHLAFARDGGELLASDSEGTVRR